MFYFGDAPSSNIAVIGGINLIKDPMGNSVRNLLLENRIMVEVKHGMNGPYKVLTKCFYFDVDLSFNMAASREHSLM